MGWAKARVRRAHHLVSQSAVVGTLRFAHPTGAVYDAAILRGCSAASITKPS